MVTFFTAQTPFVRATEQTRSAGSNILQPIGRRHAPVFAIRLSHQEITMNTTAKRSSPMLRLTALATLAVAGLAGCAAPYPVYEQPVAQPAPVYQYPSQYPQAQQQQERRDYRRRNQETLYEAPVTSVRAVVGPSTAQRCWIEREEVVQQPQRNIPGAIAGAVIGGILGHQIGNGSGRDIATVGGAVAGAAVGSNVGRNGFGGQPQTQDVQRCTQASNGQPEYWDVTYTFNGIGHRVQMTTQPGRTILVNANGEPRV
ncbi:glycine zipper 2TM domain protein [Hydrogenophaga sp. RAC07]|nr:glycine zipper 2TM domain protein [Hydrogenophaga sp. RAC07]